jgi:hypothetical protein
MAEQTADALAARPVLRPAAPVVVIQMDDLPVIKPLAAHRAGVLLELQQQIEVLPVRS